MSLPAWVQAGAVAEFEAIVVTLDAIAAGNALDATKTANFSLSVATAAAISASTPAVTATVVGWANAAQALFQMIPSLVSPLTGVDPSLPSGIVALAEGLAAALDPIGGAAAFAAAIDASPAPAAVSAGTPNRIAFAGNAAVVSRFGRAVCLAGYAECLALASFATRSAAITARADAVTRFDAELALCSGAGDIAFAEALTETRNALAMYLSRAIIDSAPSLIVSGPSLPALCWAWMIYQDPTRASDLIARNAVPVAEAMPATFEAAAP